MFPYISLLVFLRAKIYVSFTYSNSFVANVSNLYFLKTRAKQKFYSIFRRYKMRALAKTG